MSGLTLSVGTLAPMFDFATTTYTVALASSVDTLTVTPTATNAGGATITVNAAAVDIGGAVIDLTAGPPMDILIVVTAADTTTTMTYTVTATRAEADQDATLSGLTLSAGALNPVFDFATTDYTVALASSVDTLTVTPTATNAAGATITVNAAAVTSGSAVIDLTAGPPMDILIVVTAADTTTTMTYTVTATRAEGRPGRHVERPDPVRRHPGPGV